MPTVTTKGQVTIPKEVREALGIKPGSQVVFKIEGKPPRAYVKKTIDQYLDNLEKWAGCIDLGNEDVDQIISDIRGHKP